MFNNLQTHTKPKGEEKAILPHTTPPIVVLSGKKQFVGFAEMVVWGFYLLTPQLCSGAKLVLRDIFKEMFAYFEVSSGGPGGTGPTVRWTVYLSLTALRFCR